jgi:lysophospholipase L1-like esterase
VAANRIIAVGDSVMLGAALELEKRLGSMDIDAKVGRQPAAAIDVLRSYHAADQLGPVVIVHVGNNGPFSANQIDEIMQLLADVRHVVFVNIKVPRLWEGPNNAILAQKVQQYPNAVLVDWYAASRDRPELLYDDGVHLRPEGARAYAMLIATVLESP